MNLKMQLQLQLPINRQHTAVLNNGACVSYLEVNSAAKGAPLVLLHGIGSNAGSWIKQLEHGFNGSRVIAWHAPGYEASTPLAVSSPAAADYAQRLWAWLDAMNIEQVYLVGHSLGCIMAASASAQQPQRVASLLLLAPAIGYGLSSDAVRQEKCGNRLSLLKELGPAGMALKRGAALLSSTAPQADIDYAKAMMSRIHIEGYTQATALLGNSNIHMDLEVWCAASKQTSNRVAKTHVACGDLDGITPPAQCAALAQQHGIGFTTIAGAGHLCALEAAAAVNACIEAAISSTNQTANDKK